MNKKVMTSVVMSLIATLTSGTVSMVYADRTDASNTSKDMYASVYAPSGDASSDELFNVRFRPANGSEITIEDEIFTSIGKEVSYFRIGVSSVTENLYLVHVDENTSYKKQTVNELDINGDGVVDAADAAALLIVSAGLGAGNSMEDLTAYY